MMGRMGVRAKARTPTDNWSHVEAQWNQTISICEAVN